MYSSGNCWNAAIKNGKTAEIVKNWFWMHHKTAFALCRRKSRFIKNWDDAPTADRVHEKRTHFIWVLSAQG